MKMSLTFNGTGAAVYICVGVEPDEVRMLSVEDSEISYLWWNKAMRCAEVIEGVWVHAATQLGAALTVGTGISPYAGGDIMTTTNQSSTTYGEGVYLEPDPIQDYKGVDVASAGEVINAWTLGNSTNKTGNFNKESAHGFIGEGSRIKIDGKWYTITAMTDGGESANEVTLNAAAPSGVIQQITGMYDLIPVPIGKIAKAGFKISQTTDGNVNDEMQMLVIETNSANV